MIRLPEHFWELAVLGFIGMVIVAIPIWWLWYSRWEPENGDGYKPENED